MGFIKFKPLGKKITRDITTTHDVETQAWQEFGMFRHLPTASEEIKLSASYIDQAKEYYQDARGSNWKSSGLLYYYSFLNLAKAYLVTKNSIKASYLSSSNVYHGLQANPQELDNILDFKFNVHPVESRSKKNIFALLYEQLTQSKWPFDKSVEITVSEFIDYCSEIKHELVTLYGSSGGEISVYSLIRVEGDKCWFEVLVSNQGLDRLLENIDTEKIDEVITSDKLNAEDKHDWLLSHDISTSVLASNSLIRFEKIDYNVSIHKVQIKKVISIAESVFLKDSYPMPIYLPWILGIWNYSPPIELNGERVKWHPLLSNYLFSFVLSTILRYHPHHLQMGTKNSFLAEAWCNQCPIVALQYFLMDYSEDSIRLGS